MSRYCDACVIQGEGASGTSLQAIGVSMCVAVFLRRDCRFCVDKL